MDLRLEIGEQFRLLDPARMAERPVSQERWRALRRRFVVRVGPGSVVAACIAVAGYSFVR